MDLKANAENPNDLYNFVTGAQNPELERGNTISQFQSGNWLKFENLKGANISFVDNPLVIEADNLSAAKQIALSQLNNEQGGWFLYEDSTYILARGSQEENWTDTQFDAETYEKYEVEWTSYTEVGLLGFDLTLHDFFVHDDGSVYIS